MIAIFCIRFREMKVDRKYPLVVQLVDSPRESEEDETVRTRREGGEVGRD